MQTTPNVSIVIPTYNHLQDLLIPCLESINMYTELSTCEIIVVANGCTDGTEDYLRTLPPPFRFVSSKEPLGFTEATNTGINHSQGKYIVLLNNDTVLLPQPKNHWINLLLEPFKDLKVGVTGPVKFSWTCGETTRRALAFWCAMFPRELVNKIGMLDTSFSPGMGEDGDFCIRAEHARYKLVQVPKDLEGKFGVGISDSSFPIFHKGSGTFGDKDYSDITARNSKMLEDKYGKKDRLEDIYQICIKHECDTNKLFPIFRSYAEKCEHITEFGVRGVFSTYGFLVSRPLRMVSYDIEYSPNIQEAYDESKKAGINFQFIHNNVLDVVIEPTDLLFIDTKHTYSQLKSELNKHANKVNKYILVHDTESFGEKGEDGGLGEKQAIQEFLQEHTEWTVDRHIKESNGLTILARKNIKISIVIPTVQHFSDALKPCIDAVLTYTDLSNKEVIVVANGSPQETLDYLKDKPVKVIDFKEPIGYIRAVNAGISQAQGEFVVTLDDDSFLLGQPVDEWIDLLISPLADPKVVASSPFAQTDEQLGQLLHSGCTMYRTSILRQVGMFDETFNPGYMGDEDLALRLRKLGYELKEVPEGQPKKYVDGVFQLQFPVVHMGNVNTMPKYTTDLPLVEKNRKILFERHMPTTPKVSIIIPTYNHLEDLLKPCIDSILQYTNMDNVEVVVVANGCTDGTEEYVNTLGPNFKVVSFPEPLGYTKSTNEGIKVATGDFIIMFNNDNQLLDQPRHQWVEFLLDPFKDNPRMGITGPLQLHDDYADQDVIIGFCLCISRKVLNEVGGLLDEIFSPGGGEDIDLCCKVRGKDYVVRQVPIEGKLGFSHTNTGSFMIWHKNNQTFKDISEYTNWYVKRNGMYNMKRYNKNIKLNLGAGGVEFPGYLSVDLYDTRANILMDVTKLDLEDNSVSEILASHLFEHLNPYKALDVLKEWHRVLRPGGKLIMEMPNIEQLCARFVKAPISERYGILNAVYGSVNTTDVGAPSDITSPHLFGWWPESMRDHLLNAGFVDMKFGPEQIPHPESNFRVEACKSGKLETTQEHSMREVWTYSQCTEAFPYGSIDTYAKAMNFLSDCATVEDWGCGTAYARNFLKTQKYIGVDNSPSKFCDIVTNLTTYKSNVEGILIRHVLEHNFEWKKILDNALNSCQKKMVLVVFTPFSEVTKQGADNGHNIPDLFFRKEDLTDRWTGVSFTEECLVTHTQYGVEHIFYINKLPKALKGTVPLIYV